MAKADRKPKKESDEEDDKQEESEDEEDLDEKGERPALEPSPKLRRGQREDVMGMMQVRGLGMLLYEATSLFVICMAWIGGQLPLYCAMCDIAGRNGDVAVRESRGGLIWRRRGKHQGRMSSKEISSPL